MRFTGNTCKTSSDTKLIEYLLLLYLLAKYLVAVNLPTVYMPIMNLFTVYLLDMEKRGLPQYLHPGRRVDYSVVLYCNS